METDTEVNVIDATRPNTPPIPRNMRDLPVDPKRRFIVPWFVQWMKPNLQKPELPFAALPTDQNAYPDFRLADYRHFAKAMRENLCWLCGKKFEQEMRCFVIGPMCAVNRISSEPPSHPECARFAARVCPFLTMPKMRRREDEVSKAAVKNVAGEMIRRNPGVALLYFCRKFNVRLDDDKGVLFHLGEPIACEWYAEAREATRKEVLDSIESGYPILKELAMKQNLMAVVQLERALKAAMRMVPA